MAEQLIDSLMYRVVTLKQELESRSSSLLRVRRTFQDMTIQSPRFTPPELGFYQTVTWLYTFYYEAGRISLPFLLSQFSTYGLDMNETHERHFQDVHRLRTYLQHNLNLDSDRDAELQRTCNEWFANTCGSTFPGIDTEWNQCLMRILRSCEAFLEAAIGCVREIERDESSNMVTGQWTVRLNRHHPKHQFQELVSVIIHDFGQDSLDATRLTDRYYDKWSSDLRSRSIDYVFEEEARRLIEQTILSDADLPLPITGNDIMREFNIPPGPRVRRLLRKAREFYMDNPCSKDDLIEQLRNVVTQY